MDELANLNNHLLIAMPGIKNHELSQSVVYICEHKDNKTIGLIINQPMEHDLGIIFDQLNIVSSSPEIRKKPLLYGGPIQPERGFVVHKQHDTLWRSSLFLNSEVTVTTSNDIIKAIALGQGPDDVIVTMGFLGWEDEQLGIEMSTNDWLVCPLHSEILYEVPYEKRWAYAGSKLGINMNQLASYSGHA